MKKRKELNALIGLAGDGRRKKLPKKGSGHRLLRTEPPASDSESSSEGDEDEFGPPGTRSRFAKGEYLRCCKFCYPLCAFVILAACVVACVGLVWMQVALKEDLDGLKEKFRTIVPQVPSQVLGHIVLGAMYKNIEDSSFLKELTIEIDKTDEDSERGNIIIHILQMAQRRPDKNSSSGLGKVLEASQLKTRNLFHLVFICDAWNAFPRPEEELCVARKLVSRINTVESYQKTSFQEIPKLNEDLLDKQKHLEKIETGDMGLNKIWINITEINKQILFLTSVVNHLKANIKSASDLITLPVTVEELQKSVATIGSTLTSVAHDVEAMQAAIDEHKKTTERLQNDLNEYIKENGEKQISSLSTTVSPRISNRNQTENCKQDNQFLHATVEEINASLAAYQKLNDLKLLSVDTAISNITQRVTWLENSVVAVNTVENRANLSTSAVGNTTTSPKVESQDQPENETATEKAQNAKKIENVDPQVSKLREKLQLINALTSKPENERSLEASIKGGKMQTATSKPTNLPKLLSRSVGGNMERNGHPRRLSLPGIATIKDLQDLFEKTDQGIGGKLSYEDLQTLVGLAIQEPQSFKEFDTDGDEKYSLPELRLALGV